MSFPISVCIIAKNEEKYIGECLKRLMPYDMEIVVTDTGSTDKTKEIAKRYTDKVFDFTWINDFSAARNFCADKAKNNWILAIDCDEYIESIDINAMRICMQRYSKQVGKINMKSIARRSNGEVSYVDEETIRFYNRNFYKFVYPVHENIVSKKDIKGELQCFTAPIKVIHHGYNIDDEEMQEKQSRNLRLLYKQLESENIRDGYIYFQIAQSHQILGNTDKAIENYLKCLEINENTKLEYINKCIVQLASAYAQTDKPQDAVDTMEKYKDKIKSARFMYTYALALLCNEENLKALMQFVFVTTMPDKESLGEDLIHCYDYIIRLYKMFGEEKLADVFIEQRNRLDKYGKL